jgi:hypothetical protein
MDQSTSASHLDQKHSEEVEVRREHVACDTDSRDDNDEGGPADTNGSNNVEHDFVGSTKTVEEMPTPLELSSFDGVEEADDKSDDELSSSSMELDHDEGEASAHFRDHDAHNPFAELRGMASISNSKTVPSLAIVKRVGYFRNMSYAGGFVLTVIIFLCLTIYDSLQPLGTYWVNADQSHWLYLHILWAAAAFSFVSGHLILYVHMRYSIPQAELRMIQPISAVLYIMLGLILTDSYPTFHVAFYVLAVTGTAMAISLRSRVAFSTVMLDAGRQLLSGVPRLERMVRVQLCVQWVWVSIWCWLFTGTLATSRSHADGIAKSSFMLFVLGWTTQVIHAIVLSNTCGLVAAKLILNDAAATQSSLRRRLFSRSITSSFGSLSAGALVGWVGDIALELRGPALHFEEKLAATYGHAGRRHCPCCCLHPSELISRILKRCNPYGWARVALRGSPYHVASRDTWQIFQRTGVEVATQDDAASRLLWFLPQAGGTLAVLSGVWYLGAEHQSVLVPLMVALAMVGSSGLTVGAAPFAASARTIYVCFAEDPDRLQVPYPIISHRLSRVSELSHYHEQQRQMYSPVLTIDIGGEVDESEETSLVREASEI